MLKKRIKDKMLVKVNEPGEFEWEGTVTKLPSGELFEKTPHGNKIVCFIAMEWCRHGRFVEVDHLSPA